MMLVGVAGVFCFLSVPGLGEQVTMDSEIEEVSHDTGVSVHTHARAEEGAASLSRRDGPGQFLS